MRLELDLLLWCIIINKKTAYTTCVQEEYECVCCTDSGLNIQGDFLVGSEMPIVAMSFKLSLE